MCGIGGVLELTDEIEKKFLNEINDVQKHRGPDAKGTWVSRNNKVGFSHTRLSILDTSSNANQPFSDSSKNFTISFNGEIYNYEEIKETLVKKGYKFKTKNSDTEVLLYSYIEWKKDCLKYLRGMFAFSIWDETEKKLWLVRDRVGVKPLYYKKDKKRIIFASEIKSILLDKNYVREIDEESLFHYLTFCCSPVPRTMFKNIKKLEAGHHLTIDLNGRIIKKKYWDPIENKKIDLKPYEESFYEDILNKIKHSIKLRNIADVDTGVFLSGGIDSSVNAYLSSKISNKSINTFSIGYDKDYNSYKSELKYAKMVATDVKSNHYEKKLSKKDFTNIIQKVVYHQDEPISDPVCIPIYYLSEMSVNNNVKVCQVGEGADELFFGYTNWARTSKINRMFNNPFFINPIKKVVAKLMRLFSLDHKHSHDLLTRSIKKLPIFWSGAEAFTESEKFRIFSDNMKDKFKNKSSWDIIKPHFDFFKKNMEYKNIENWMTYIDLKLRLPELLLMRIDKMSMSCGLEARVPFLDHKLVEKLIDIPRDIKFKQSKLKIILKECVKNLIPSSIIKRKKQGFGLPLKDWFSDGLGMNEKEIILDFIKNTDYFNIKEIEKILLNRNDDTRVWFLLNLAIWWKMFIKEKVYLQYS